MAITNFLTMKFLSGFTGTIVGVELLIACTKELPGIKRIPTRFYTFILALIHLVVVSFVAGSLAFTIGNFYLMVINALLISVILCGGYDVVIGNVKIPQIINSKKQDSTIKINPDSNNSKESNESKTNGVNDINVENNNEEAIASLSNRGRNSNINDKEI